MEWVQAGGGTTTRRRVISYLMLEVDAALSHDTQGGTGFLAVIADNGLVSCPAFFASTRCHKPTAGGAGMAVGVGAGFGYAGERWHVLGLGTRKARPLFAIALRVHGRAAPARVSFPLVHFNVNTTITTTTAPLLRFPHRLLYEWRVSTRARRPPRWSVVPAQSTRYIATPRPRRASTGPAPHDSPHTPS
jgi:hypothetical protein